MYVIFYSFSFVVPFLYTKDNKSYINVYFKDDTKIKEDTVFVDIYQNSKTFYVRGNRYKIMQDKLND